MNLVAHYTVHFFDVTILYGSVICLVWNLFFASNRTIYDFIRI